MIGFPATFTNAFGMFSVSGSKRFPTPAAKIIASISSPH